MLSRPQSKALDFLKYVAADSPNVNDTLKYRDAQLHSLEQVNMTPFHMPECRFSPAAAVHGQRSILSAQASVATQTANAWMPWCAHAYPRLTCKNTACKRRYLEIDIAYMENEVISM